MSRPSEDVARQVLVGGQFRQIAVDIGRINGHRHPIHLGGVEGDLLQQPFQHRMQAAGADVLGALVDLPGDLGDAADAVFGELQIDPFGG